MTELVLKRDPNSDDGEFYLVHYRGKVIGRIFDRLPGASARGDATWFWGLSFEYQKTTPFYGSASSREAAMEAFRAAWERRRPSDK